MLTYYCEHNKIANVPENKIKPELIILNHRNIINIMENNL